VDPARHFSLVLLDDFRPANQHEEIPVAALLKQLPTFYPDLQLVKWELRRKKAPQLEAPSFSERMTGKTSHYLCSRLCNRQG
jgi:hypothetical protein